MAHPNSSQLTLFSRLDSLHFLILFYFALFPNFQELLPNLVLEHGMFCLGLTVKHEGGDWKFPHFWDKLLPNPKLRIFFVVVVVVKLPLKISFLLPQPLLFLEKKAQKPH